MFTGELYQIFKELTPILLKLFQNGAEMEHFWIHCIRPQSPYVWRFFCPFRCARSSASVQQALCENRSICRCVLDVLVRRGEFLILFCHLDSSPQKRHFCRQKSSRLSSICDFSTNSSNTFKITLQFL